MQKKSAKNKTIDFSEQEGKIYLERCFFPDASTQFSLSELQDKTICADSFEILQRLPHSIFPLIIADPPYNLSKQYASSKFLIQNNAEYKSYTKDWLSKTIPLLTENGSMYICTDWKSSIILGQVLCEYEEEGEIILRNRITWEREKGRGANSNWKNCLEDIWFFTKGKNYTFNTEAVKVRKKVIAPYKKDGKPKDWTQTEQGNFRDTFPSNFWNDITIPFWSMPENTAHPTQKSEKLLAKLILCSSNSGDLVFDPFGGSGSTAVTAKKLGRHWCSIEREKLFCAWAQYRLEKAESNKTIQGFEDGIFHQRNE
ncbi:site-specific DNA-methyltransferase [Treponema pectinovorum]|uniref:DNA-methyltransferase n=1 Tax=Treponema pectinovorum TaxID=164 RepID=UPI003D93591D